MKSGQHKFFFNSLTPPSLPHNTVSVNSVLIKVI